VRVATGYEDQQCERRGERIQSQTFANKSLRINQPVLSPTLTAS